MYENIPLLKFDSFMSLLNYLKTPNISDIKISDNIGYTSKFTNALNHVIEENVNTKLIISPYITVLTEESTDRVVNKHLVICQGHW